MERRKYIRVPSRLLANVKVLYNKDKIFLKRQSKNISGSGILLELEEQFPIGALLELNFVLPTSLEDKITVHGKVVRVNKIDNNKIDTGIEFLSITESDRRKIVEFTKKVAG